VSFVIVMVLMLVVMYVLMIRPQRQRQANQQSMIDSAGVGDDILTTGGIYGTVTQADGDDIVVELAEGLTVHMTRRAIAAVLPPEEEEESDDVVEGEATEAEDEEQADEAGVADEEDAVRSEGAEGTNAGPRL
jgi:preprotein translocase subunit YajC